VLPLGGWSLADGVVVVEVVAMVAMVVLVAAAVIAVVAAVAVLVVVTVAAAATDALARSAYCTHLIKKTHKRCMAGAYSRSTSRSGDCWY
jgi:uncharacterized membrane protein